MKLLPLIFASAMLAACSGVDGSVDPVSGPAKETNSTLPAPSDMSSSGSQETRAAVCEKQAQKHCLDRVDVPTCEKELSVFSEGFLRAFGACVDRIASCDSRAAVQVCEEEALAAIAPGFPDVPVIARCKSKNLSCSTAYPRDKQIKPQIDTACETLVGLEEKTRIRGEACIAEAGCKQFANCINDIF